MLYAMSAPTLFEHAPKMESYEEISDCLWENPKETKYNSSDLIFFKNMKFFLECTFVFLPSVGDKSEFTSTCTLQLASVVCLYDSMEKCDFAMF